jgi:four helix bundle protein
MAKYQSFEELPVWREAARLYNRVLDLLQEPNLPLSSGFRNQLDRAALSISNNVAEGFERLTTSELISFLAIAKGSGGEVRSMLAVVKDRPRLRPFIQRLTEIRELAESCGRQLGAWMGSIEDSPVKGKRHLDAKTRQAKQTRQAAEEYRLRFLRNLKPEHPLYGSEEARAARGEME